MGAFDAVFRCSCEFGLKVKVTTHKAAPRVVNVQSSHNPQILALNMYHGTFQITDMGVLLFPLLSDYPHLPESFFLWRGWDRVLAETH